MTDVASEIIQLVEERGEFVTGDDGYVVYWPNVGPVTHSTGGTTGGGGAYDAGTLRIISDELNRRNAAWDAEVRKALSRLNPGDCGLHDSLLADESCQCKFEDPHEVVRNMMKGKGS